MIYSKYIKRFIDVVMSLTSILLLLLPFLLISLIILLDSRGGIFFRQRRSGKDKEPFYILKFRTMPTDTPHYIASNDLPCIESRCTRFQKFLRRSSIDELPQLLNILKGDMSIIGPRPVICQETDLIEERDKYGANNVRPGLTGWAQINGRDNLNYIDKARLDGEYVRNISFLFDVKCFLLTIGSVIRHDGFNDNVLRHSTAQDRNE